jgi:hypothetical protein
MLHTGLESALVKDHLTIVRLPYLICDFWSVMNVVMGSHLGSVTLYSSECNLEAVSLKAKLDVSCR